MTNEARIETSTVCNYHCTFCPHSDLTRRKAFMSMDLYKIVLSKLPKEIEVVTLSGLGEMFLDPTIFDKIYMAKALGYKVNALTNGSMMDDETIMKLNNSGIDSVRISIHAYNIVKYIEITGASVQSYLNVHNLLAKIDKDIETILTVDLVEPEPFEVDIFRGIYENQVDLLEIWKVHNWAGWADYREDPDERKMTCGRPFNGPLQIQVDGTVNMCCFDYDGKLTIGDLKTQSIDEIFTGNPYEAILNFHNGDRSDKDLLCNQCDQLYPKDSSILLYNSRYTAKERINKLSTTYKELS